MPCGSEASWRSAIRGVALPEDIIRCPDRRSIWEALRRKRLKTVCAAGIRKSAMQAPQRRIFRTMVHTGRLRKPDGGAGVRRNDLTVNRVTNEVAQPFFNLWAERRKKRAERRGGGLTYAGTASGSSTMAATILAFISLFPAFKAVPDYIRRPVGICTYRKRALQRY